MKRALITGGSGDIGGAIGRRLGADGFHVIVHAGRRLEQAQAVAEAITAAGGSAEAVSFDVGQTAACADALRSVLERGPIQVLVNNAGIHNDAPLAGMGPDQWHEVVNVSLNGFYNVTHPLLMEMMRTRWGRIINMSSVAGVLGNRGQANYAAAKAGLHAAGKSLALEVASRGITVNTVAPGVIAGRMTEALFDSASIRQIVPAQRAGTPEEVAGLVSFLASDIAGYISGQCIGINGAMA